MKSLEEIVPTLAGKKVLFLGKTRTMSDEDIALFLEQVKAQRAENEEDGPIGLIVLGRLLNPLEEAYSDARYKEGVPVVDLEKLERYYAAHIDPDALLGSLALFANQERIINLLHNTAIGDALFCEILQRYDWQGAGPFETDENRDVAGTLVARFYPDIEKNHNIQYSPVGPFLVAAQSDFAPLLEAMAQIPDYEVTQRSQDPWMPRTLHESLLINPHLPVEVLEALMRGDVRRQGFAAAHPGLPADRQRALAQSGERWILEGLARHPNLDATLRDALLENDEPSVRLAALRYQPLDETMVETILDRGDDEELSALGMNERLTEALAMRLAESGNETVRRALAANDNLTPKVYEALEATKDPDVLRNLAANDAVDAKLLERLTRIRDKSVFVALAGNPSMPPARLKQFAAIKDRDIHKALAANPATPIEILLGYQTDGELNQILKRNEAYGEYIRQTLGM
jgi:hypothetical protein